MPRFCNAFDETTHTKGTKTTTFEIFGKFYVYVSSSLITTGQHLLYLRLEGVPDRPVWRRFLFTGNCDVDVGLINSTILIQ